MEHQNFTETLSKIFAERLESSSNQFDLATRIVEALATMPGSESHKVGVLGYLTIAANQRIRDLYDEKCEEIETLKEKK